MARRAVLTITGFNLGFGGLGGGLSCPKLTFGGGGPPLGTIGLGVGPGSGLYLNGTWPTADRIYAAEHRPGQFLRRPHVKKASLIASTALGVVLGAVLFNAPQRVCAARHDRRGIHRGSS